MSDEFGYFHHYKVFKNGEIFGNRYKKPLKHRIDWSGYPKVDIMINGKQVKTSVHRILAIVFISNPENKPYVNHIDGNRKNFSLDNLEWVTAKENSIDGIKRRQKNKIESVYHKIKKEEVLKIYDLLNQGKHPVEICKEFNISKYSVFNIARLRTWKWLADSVGFKAIDRDKGGKARQFLTKYRGDK